jgi:hypothetical protein
MLRTTERFVGLELHPAIYVSFVAINLCVVFVYREMNTAHHVVSVSPSFAGSRLDDHHGLRPNMAHVELMKTDARLIAANVATTVFDPNAKVNDTALDGSLAAALVPAKPVEVLKSSGAAIAAAPEKAPRPRKKSRRSYSGLVPPPPPGVLVVPPPPDAPSLFVGGSAGKFSFLVPPPPPMVLDEFSSAEPSHRVGARKTSAHRHYGDRRDNDRARTVTRGNYKHVIVSR